MNCYLNIFGYGFYLGAWNWDFNLACREIARVTLYRKHRSWRGWEVIYVPESQNLEYRAIRNQKQKTYRLRGPIEVREDVRW